MTGSSWVEFAVTILVTIIASNGFWVFMQNKLNKKSAQTQMLIGLGHDRIIYLGNKYIDRGYITTEEYDNLYNYLYLPYVKCGGNGTAKHVMDQVQKLPHRVMVEECDR